MQVVEKTGQGGKDFPPTWKPEHTGDTVEGKIVRREVGRLIELETGGGNKTVWASQLLESALVELNAQVGDSVKIEWLGMQKS